MIKKIISGIVCFSFLTTNAVWAFPVSGIELRPHGETPSFLQVEIPQELASIEEIYEAPAKQDPHLILHIQNAHGNYEAQLQIKIGRAHV